MQHIEFRNEQLVQSLHDMAKRCTEMAHVLDGHPLSNILNEDSLGDRPWRLKQEINRQAGLITTWRFLTGDSPVP